MRILVTRPLEDGAEIARLLADMGHEALLAPLLTVRISGGPKLTLAGVQAVLATSANGVRAVAARSDMRDVPLFAVGPQTAEAAARAGFIRVRNAGGDAAALADAVCGWADTAAGPLLHAAGEESGGAIAGCRHPGVEGQFHPGRLVLLAPQRRDFRRPGDAGRAFHRRRDGGLHQRQDRGCSAGPALFRHKDRHRSQSGGASGLPLSAP